MASLPRGRGLSPPNLTLKNFPFALSLSKGVCANVTHACFDKVLTSLANAPQADGS
jgi:hypothetical protein